MQKRLGLVSYLYLFILSIISVIIIILITDITIDNINLIDFPLPATTECVLYTVRAGPKDECVALMSVWKSSVIFFHSKYLAY